MRSVRRVAIVGGGPAGASAAAAAAGAGAVTTLFHVDPSHGEKPCGGGVTVKGVEAFDFLLRTGIEFNPIRRIRILNTSGRAVDLTDDHPFFYIYDRGELDRALRSRAVDAGARLEPVHVESVARVGSGFSVNTSQGDTLFDFVVAADGAFSRTRRLFTNPIAKRNLCPAVDELVEGIDPESGVTLAFFRDVTGYLWVFPRKRLASVGMVAREGELRGDLMRTRVREFLQKHHPGARTVRSVGWAIPAPDQDYLSRENNWAPGSILLAGDAAGFADPLTGEGIYYAMESGRAAGLAAAAGDPALYLSVVNAKIAPELACASRWTTRYFRPKYLDSVLFAARFSPRVRAVLRDVLSGRQEYGGLSSRLRRELGLLGTLFRIL